MSQSFESVSKPTIKSSFFVLTASKILPSSSLTKFSSLIPAIQALHTEIASLPSNPLDEASLARFTELYKNQSQARAALADQINKSKKKADEELNMLDRQTDQLLDEVRVKACERLDAYQATIKLALDNFSKDLQLHSHAKALKEPPSHTELNKRIFENKDTAQAEDALRSVLKETQLIQNSKSGKSTESLNQSKGKLEQCCKNSFVLPAHKRSSLQLTSGSFERILGSHYSRATDKTW